MRDVAGGELSRLLCQCEDMISQILELGAIGPLGETQLQEPDLELFQGSGGGQPLGINAEEIAQQGEAEGLTL